MSRQGIHRFHYCKNYWLAKKDDTVNKNAVLKNLIWRFGERISAQLVTFVVSIVIARILSPADYGAVAIIMVFITIANILVVNGFATALIQKKDADELDFSSVFFFSIAFSVALYALLFFAAPYIARWYDMDILCPALRILGIRIIIGAVNSVQQSYVSRRMEFKKFFFSTLGGTVLSGGVGIGMAYAGFGVWALVAQYLVNTTTDTIVLWFTVKWRPRFIFSWQRLKGLLNYGWKLLASALLGALYDDLRTLIIGKVYSTSDLAYYSKGQQFPSLIMNNVNVAVSSVFFSALSKLQDEPNRLAAANRKFVQMLCGVLAPLMFGLAAVGEPLVEILLTEKWLPCVPFLRICCMYYLISSVYNAYLQSFKAVGKSGFSLGMEIVDDIIGILLVIAFFRVSVMAVAWVTIISRTVACILTIVVNAHLFHISLAIQWRDILGPVGAAFAMAIIVLLVGKLVPDPVLGIVLQIVVGMISYAVIALALKLPIAQQMISWLKKNRANQAQN